MNASKRPAAGPPSVESAANPRVDNAPFEAMFDASPIAMALATLDGRWERVNAAFSKLVGYSAVELQSIGVEALIGVGQLSQDGLTRSFETVLLHAGDGPVDIEVSVAGLDSTDGLRAIVALRDISVRRSVERELQHARDDLQLQVSQRTAKLQRALLELNSHVENSPLAVIEWDARFRVTRWSRRAAELFGWRAEELMGRSPDEWRFVHEEDQLPVEVVMSRLLGGEARNSWKNRNYTRDGRVLYCEWFNSVITNAEGQLDTVLSLVHDVTAQQQRESSLRESESQFRSIFEQSAVGLAHVGLDGSWLRINRQLCDIVGYSEEELRQLTFQDITHPDDLEEDLALAEDLVAGRRDHYELDKRYIRKNGTVVWIRLTGSIRRGEDGSPLHFIAAVQNISAQKRAEDERSALLVELEQRVSERTAELRASEHRITAITNNLPALVAYIDAGLHYRFANETYRHWYGLEPAALIGVDVHSWAGDDYSRLQPYLQRALAGEAVQFEHFENIGTAERWISVSYVPDRAADGSVIGFHSMGIDISAGKLLEQNLSLRALSDGMTGLLNRTALLQQLVRVQARASREHSRFAVLFIDLDGFKALNDRFGHQAGDRTLCAVADAIRDAVRRSDTVARIGGDEFVVVLEALVAPDHEAARVATKLIEAVGKPVDLDGRTASVGASIGVLLCDGSTVPVSTLLAQADALMYGAKAGGRNRFEIGNLQVEC